MLKPVTVQEIAEARDQATDLRDRVTMNGEAEEAGGLEDTVAWLAAEVRCQRLEDCLERGK
jgi:hypothetical protein